MSERVPERAAPYGTFVDWDARLGREERFFRALLEDAGVRTVIDVGAGSARHAIMFATWGLDVRAVDPSEEMRAEAAANLERFADDIEGGGGRVELFAGGFGDLEGLELGPADALICTGNALPHVGDIVGLRAAFADFAAVCAPGAVVVLHLLNHAHIISSGQRLLPTKVRDDSRGRRVFVRVLEPIEDDTRLAIDFITLTRPEGGEWETVARHSEHAILLPSVIVAELQAAGFTAVQAFGNHDGRLLDEQNDESMIVVAKRG